MPFLLDVNALIAMAWDTHLHHATVRSWWAQREDREWRTCAITELGFLRISSNPKVPSTSMPLGVARDLLGQMRAVPGHAFLPDDVSPMDDDVAGVHGHRQLTDAHLLALAHRHDAQVVTFDSGLRALDARGKAVLLLR